MPSLIRFFAVILVLCALAGAAIIYLAVFVEPTAREMTIKLPASRLDP